MTVPVVVEAANGTFTASVPGVPGLRAVADTRDRAVGALRDEVAARVSAGELMCFDIEPVSLEALGDKYKDDPGWAQMWDDIVTEAYRYRDELKAAEFPE